LTVEPVPLREVAALIDWGPFFHTWDLRGTFPAIFESPKYGAQARELYENARETLHEILEKNSLGLRGVYGFFPAAAEGDDVVLYTDATRSTERMRFCFLRQQREKQADKPHRSLADFIAPRGTGLPDHLGAFAVTSGFGLPELIDRARAENDDYKVIMVEALADRMVEAFAEWLHARVRKFWGYGRGEDLSVADLVAEKYRGIRPAPGYPACPDHTEKGKIWELLQVQRRIGMRLTESYAMWPGASVSGLYFGHPEARYFGVGSLGQDQIADYSERKKMPLRDVERWLGPWLGYNPQT
jgi:5-methyltetrahydrofolate--homocysteine methyltransferase